MWKSCKTNASLTKRAKYKKCVKLLKRDNFSNNLKFEESVIRSNNLGAIYKHVNARLTHKSCIAPLKNSKDEVIVDNKEKAELLNTHFVSVGTVDDGVLPLINFATNDSLDSICFDLKKISKVISKIKINSSAGPDGFAPIFFKKLQNQLVYPLSILFTSIQQNGTNQTNGKRQL